MEPKKNIFIIGDSYSTYEGYIPEGYGVYYSDNNLGEGGVRKTWWYIVKETMNCEVVMNDSYSGSTVCTTVRPAQGIKASFVKRAEKYIDEGFFEKTPVDTIFIFGGTNDSWIDSPIGDYTYEDFNDENLKCVLPAYAYIIERLKAVPQIRRIVVIANTDIKEEIIEGAVEIAKHYGVDCVKLASIDKVSGHPTELGMKQIAEQVLAVINK